MNSWTSILKRRAPHLVSFASCIGVIASVVLSGKASARASKKIFELERDSEEVSTPYDKTRFVWREYVPTALMTVATLLSIACSSRLHTMQHVKLMVAYAELRALYAESKRDDRHPVDFVEIVSVDHAMIQSNHLLSAEPTRWDEVRTFWLELYGYFFERTMRVVKMAEYNLNRQVALEGYASLNDFYRLLDLSPSQTGEDLGWRLSTSPTEAGSSFVDFDHRVHHLDGGLEVCEILFISRPIMDYQEAG